MGTWDKGNFDNDSALDMLDMLMDRLQREIVYYFAPERREWLKHGSGMTVMAAIDMLLALQEHTNTLLHNIYPRLVRYWRDIYLKVYDETGEWKGHGHQPTPEFVAARRQVIIDTFARFESAADDDDEDDGAILP